MKAIETQTAPKTLEGFRKLLLDSLTNSIDKIELWISPMLAREIIENWNAKNRRLNEVRIQGYRREMEAQKWGADTTIGFGIFPEQSVLGDGSTVFSTSSMGGIASRQHGAPDCLASLPRCAKGRWIKRSSPQLRQVEPVSVVRKKTSARPSCSPRARPWARSCRNETSPSTAASPTSGCTLS
jgi:hypothetical protein